MEKLRGRVAWFNNAKGFGFLSHDGGPDVFVHFTSIQTEGYKSLNEGEEVLFSIVQGAKGPQADGVERVSPAELVPPGPGDLVANVHDGSPSDGTVLYFSH